MRQVSYRDEQADEAVERIVRLDHRAVSHPAIRRWLVSKGHTLDSLIEELDRGGGVLLEDTAIHAEQAPSVAQRSFLSW
jgi:hypothetical protein